MDGWIHKTSRRRRMTASGDGKSSTLDQMLSTPPTSLEQERVAALDKDDVSITPIAACLPACLPLLSFSSIIITITLQINSLTLLSSFPCGCAQTPCNQRPSYSTLPSDLTWFCRYPLCPMTRAMPSRSRTARQHLQLPLLLHRLQQHRLQSQVLAHRLEVWSKSGEAEGDGGDIQPSAGALHVQG